MRSYDLLVIGSGPAGIQAALRARQAGRRSAVVERRSFVGGMCIHKGTIPSKTLRQAVMDLSGFRHWGLYRTGPARRPRLDMADLRARCDEVIAAEVRFQEDLLASRGIELIRGSASFVDANILRVTSPEGSEDIHGDQILVSVGSRPYHPGNFEFDGRRVLDSDQILDLKKLPSSMIVIGGGVIGSEYGSIFSLMDMQVTVVNRDPHLLSFLDRTLIDELERILVAREVDLQVNASVDDVQVLDDGVRLTLSNGSMVEAEAALFCAGRQGAASLVNPGAAGLEVDSRGRFRVDADFRTSVPSIFAAGDVIGFPSLASVSREQGRVAACRALDIPCRPVGALLPYGIYTVPEIATVGITEEEAREQGIPVETGIGRYDETARGQIIGDTSGLLKLVVHRDTKRILGAHLMGTGAAELVHFAQIAMELDAEYLHFVRMVMNYPTLARVFKVAAWKVLEKLGD